MSNLWLNVSFGCWHLQCEGFKVRIKRNRFYEYHGVTITKPTGHTIIVHEAPWKRRTENE